jgi:hypothetical protein
MCVSPNKSDNLLTLRISNKYGSLNLEQIPYKSDYLEITCRVFKIRIISKITNSRLLIGLSLH